VLFSLVNVFGARSDAQSAFHPAAELVEATGAALLLVHVEPYTAAMWMPEYVVASGARLDAEAAAATRAYLDEVKGRLSHRMASWSPELATRCAACGRLISTVPEPEARCPRCARHLHACINCGCWDTTGCVLQRTEAHTAIWPGRNCPQFTFRLSARPAGSPHLTQVDATAATAP
jgi:hypothetical protein